MKRKSPARKKTGTPPRPRERRYRVSLPFEQTLELTAESPEQAWRRYCRQRGIVRSDHVPRIEPLD